MAGHLARTVIESLRYWYSAPTSPEGGIFSLTGFWTEPYNQCNRFHQRSFYCAAATLERLNPRARRPAGTNERPDRETGDKPARVKERPPCR